MSDYSDPLTTDFFNPPPTPHKEFKPHEEPKVGPPGIDQLYAIQKNLVLAVNAALALEHRLPKDHHRASLVSNVESAYKGINTYLREFGNKGLKTF